MSLFDLFLKKNACPLLVSTEGKMVDRYNHFRDFLVHNHDALNRIAELEQISRGDSLFDLTSVQDTVEALMQSTRGLVEALNGISQGRYEELLGACRRIEGAIQVRLESERGNIARETAPSHEAPKRDPQPIEPGTAAYPAGSPVLLASGQAASPGAASGVVVKLEGKPNAPLPKDAILVTRTASPDYALYLNRVKGLITDVGGVACHLATVAREFAIPAIVGSGSATSLLRDGQRITLVVSASGVAVYDGELPEIAESSRSKRVGKQESNPHQALRDVLDWIAPLHLTDPQSASFSPEGCQTIHDLIRFAHETVMREMFLLAESGGQGARSLKLTSFIPMAFHCIDLGGGVKEALTTCDTLTPEEIESVPMKALWRGFTHPGITWAGTIAFDSESVTDMLASSATAELGASLPGGDSYAILARDYLNLSAKFGYHFANVDAFCSESEAGQNHILIQFSGGAGSFVGRSLRVRFLANILRRLGFSVDITGDLLDAGLKGLDAEGMSDVLDQLGRLLASSRLLDMAIPDEDAVDRMTEAFFRGDYEHLTRGQSSQLPGFYTHTGHWRVIEEDGLQIWLQDGTKWSAGLSSTVARFLGRAVGARYRDFLESVGVPHHFPMAVARDSAVADAVIEVDVRPLAGQIDQVGGLVFGMKDLANYFGVGLNGLDDHVILFEVVNNDRVVRQRVRRAIETGRWVRLRVVVSGRRITGYVDGDRLIEYEAERIPEGHVGLWTKADSVVGFGSLTIDAKGKTRRMD